MSDLVCAFGEPFFGDHPKCRAFVKQGREQFRRDVEAGIYDEEGYRPAERKAAEKAAHAAGRLF